MGRAVLVCRQNIMTAFHFWKVALMILHKFASVASVCFQMEKLASVVTTVLGGESLLGARLVSRNYA